MGLDVCALALLGWDARWASSAVKRTFCKCLFTTMGRRRRKEARRRWGEVARRGETRGWPMCADTSGRPILAKEQTGLACVFVQVVFAAGSVCLFAYACVYVCVVHKPDDFLYVGHQIRLIDLWFRLLKSIAGNIRFSPAISHPVRAGYIQCSLNEQETACSRASIQV